MNNIKQKQIEDLVFDISRLYMASDVFNRETTYTLGTPGEGEAQLNNQTATSVTTLHIHTKDTLTGNRFKNLESFQKNDTLILQTQSGEIAKYNILSIQSVVDSSNEGHFILTLQHSFGYSGSFSIGKISYYFRRSASDVLIQDIESKIALFKNDVDIKVLLETFARNSAITSRKKVFTSALSSSTVTITHDLGDEDVIVQVINPSGVVVDCTIDNFTLNTVDVSAVPPGNYKIIIIS